MLIERTFTLGGYICVALGVTFVGTALALGPVAWPLLIPGVMFTGFGVFFLSIGRDARHERLELLRLGESGSQDRNSGRPRT